MSNEKLAFLIGLLGSVHCVAMCGPLAFAVPLHQPGWAALLWNKLIYQLGRIISYCLLGALVGLVGGQIWQAGFQQGVSILTGVLIIMAGCSRIFKQSMLKQTSFVSLKFFNAAFDYALKHKANHLIIGMINGLLPCGFVYLALAGALNTKTVFEGVSYMFWFGTGTVPMMLAAAIVLSFSKLSFRNKLNKVMPYAMLLLGIWFVFRGLELNIPYISPQQPNATTECK
ncbi:sulfite exporter TauE/SafE family protein [Pedobacter psychroterrae]|uniref:Sulfite exporter TauE/SafE family protein n=1 Tax=Pedobacter psychroterrae TaxID=2530453 RepID=A0A4R0NNA0_9SPHI|nr:sulfite exporter TauE/SafE family protein [Pedobacter psychroterrae]TCD01113.1 sulfite exporter TauE/SafE family protein [Pedobacter psychroterrae]